MGKYTGFRINSIVINNFRSFKLGKDCGLKKLNETNVVLLTGLNNSGKTNILRAISVFFNPEIYDKEVDLNYITSLQKSSAFTKIAIEFYKEKEKIKIVCDFSKIEECKGERNYLKLYTSNKLTKSKEIKKFIDSFKCLFTSVIDEKINEQVNDLSELMLVQYYSKRNKKIKKKIEEFGNKYRELCESFNSNISEIECALSEQFVDIGEDISAKFEINKEFSINEFLKENIDFKIDDTYAHEIASKGSGIQRMTLIYMNLYLLKELYPQSNLIFLLDEPEAFMYPKLQQRIAQKIGEEARNSNLQIFITTHSREFIGLKNNTKHFTVYTEKEEKEVKRKNKNFMNKYSVVRPYELLDFNQTYRNYGMLDGINDYEYVVLCEGETDVNYLKFGFDKRNFSPQIMSSQQYKYNYMGKGAEGIMSQLSFLNEFNVKRKVFVLLDSDEEGKKVWKKINNNKKAYKNLDIFVKHCLDQDDKEIEDLIYDETTLLQKIEKVCQRNNYKYSYNLFEELSSRKWFHGTFNYMDSIKKFCESNGLSDYNEQYMKCLLSLNLEEDEIPLKLEELLTEITTFMLKK